MPTARVRDAQIEYDVWGEGDQDLLLVPGGVVSSSLQPLASALTRVSPNGFRMVQLQRRGYGGSSRPTSPFSLEDQALDCLAFMDNLDLERAHVVGHSMSGLIALQMAQVAPERIRSLVLIEPSLIRFVPGALQAGEGMAKSITLYQSGDRVAAVDLFMRGVAGEDYRRTMDNALPAGWFEQAAQSLDVFFPIELPSIRSWTFDARERVTQPILSVYGTEKRWGGAADTGAEFDHVVRSWFPQTESLAIPGAYHWPQITNTPELAREITGFVRRHAP